MNNTYGNVKSAFIDPESDVEIFYHYRPTLNTTDIENNDFKKIDDVSSILKKVNISKDAKTSNNQNYPDLTLTGMYNLSLPVSLFGKKGFYTIFIRPKEIYCTIQDVGVLGAYPDISGIIVDLNSIQSNRQLFSNDNLVGYRIEYLQYENNGVKRQDYYRLVTSCNLAEPVKQNLTSAYANSNAYRFTDSGSLSFITLTPSTTPSFKNNSKPYIGSPNQQIIITNTKFDPLCVRVEICENDFDTIATSIDGNQIRSLDNGLLTTYNENNEIYKQWEFYTLKDSYNKNAKFEVKTQRKNNIDSSIDANEIFNQ